MPTPKQISLPDIDDLVVRARTSHCGTTDHYSSVMAWDKNSTDIIIELVPQTDEPPFYMLHWFTDYSAEQAAEEITRFGTERMNASYYLWHGSHNMELTDREFLATSHIGASALRVFTETDDESSLLWRLTDDFDKVHSGNYPAKFVAFLSGITRPDTVKNYIERTRTSEHTVDLDKLLPTLHEVYDTYVALVTVD